MRQLADNQVVIQVLLVIAVIVMTFMLTRTTSGVRGLAARRILTVLFAVFAIVAILSPRLITSLARMVGVTRGADLLLYALIVAFFGYVIISQRREANRERQITLLSRKLALLAAPTEREVELARARHLDDEELAPVGPDSPDAIRSLSPTHPDTPTDPDSAISGSSAGATTSDLPTETSGLESDRGPGRA